VVERASGCFLAELVGIVETNRNPGGYLVAGASPKRIVKLALQEETPGVPQDRS
jgi:hypothetical protein